MGLACYILHIHARASHSSDSTRYGRSENKHWPYEACNISKRFKTKIIRYFFKYLVDRKLVICTDRSGDASL